MRGAFVFALAALVMNVPSPASRAQSPPPQPNVRRFLHVPAPSGASGTEPVLITLPRTAFDAEGTQVTRLPIVVALHGAREATHSHARALLAWPDDYRADEAFLALARGSLTREDFGGLVRASTLERLNSDLRRTPFRGVALVTVYTPNLLGLPPGAPEIRAYADWVADVVVPAVRREVSVAPTREGTAIDGVSLGGRLALEIGFMRQDVFGVVGGIQPALGGHARAIATAARRGYTRGRPVVVRLLSSDEDGGLAGARLLFEALSLAGVGVTLSVFPGRHGYEFNRGPGAIELLRYHDRTLRGAARTSRSDLPSN